MSTVPKLTYAKIGKGPKAKVESASSQLTRNYNEKSDDLFSHMNQENLKYIQKELKLKKNRSDQEPTRTNPPDFRDTPQEIEQQLTQRDKLYHKYRREEAVVEREPHLQQTQRCSDTEKPLFMVFNEQADDQFEPGQNLLYQQEIRQVKLIQNKPNTGESKMYQSLPQNEGKKRMASIQNHFGQAMSTNLNKQDGAQFIEFLEEYISDLNQSIHLKTKQNQEMSVEKQQFDQLRNSKQKQKSSRVRLQKENRQLDDEMKERIKRLQKIKRSSDTFGQPNSKFTLKSLQIYNQSQIRQLQLQLKQQKLNNINLAKQIQKLRELLQLKQNIIKKLQIENELFHEQILHVQKTQEIMNRNRKSTQNLREFQNIKNQIKSNHFNNQNLLQRDTSNLHYRNSSANHQKAAKSYRSSFKLDDFQELFQNSIINTQTQKEPQFIQKKNRQTQDIQKLKKQYGRFLEQVQNTNYKYKKKSRKPHQFNF